MKAFDLLKRAKVIEKIEKFDLPNGEFTMTRPSTEAVAGPLTGIEYCTPLASYH